MRLPVLLSILLLAACQPAPSEDKPKVAPAGREETQGIRATESTGYAGEAIADRVDGALDAGEAHQRALQQAE